MTNHAACEDALSLVQKQRDQAMARADKAEEERDHFREVAATFRDKFTASEPRPLTPDAITDEMIERAAHCMAMQEMPTTYSFHPDSTAEEFYDEAREVLHAALTEPPARPEGAEEIEAYMREIVASHPEDHYGELADHLASRGVLPPITDKTNPEKETNR